MTDRLRYGKKYVLEKKIKNISRSYDIKDYNIKYSKAIKNLYNKLKTSKKNEFVVNKSRYKELNGKDSRELLVRGVYSLFRSLEISDKLIKERYPNKTQKEIELLKKRFHDKRYTEMAVEVIDTIVNFINKRNPNMQSVYVQIFSEIFYQLLIKKEKGELVVQGNKFFIESFNEFKRISNLENQNILSNQGKLGELNPVYEYIRSISGDFLPYVSKTRENKSKKFVIVQNFKKEKYFGDVVEHYIVR